MDLSQRSFGHSTGLEIKPEIISNALKYDGVNLSLLELIFGAVSETEIVDYIKSRPTGKYARRIWFFYESLTEQQLPIKDITAGNGATRIDVPRLSSNVQEPV